MYRKTKNIQREKERDWSIVQQTCNRCWLISCRRRKTPSLLKWHSSQILFSIWNTILYKYLIAHLFKYDFWVFSSPFSFSVFFRLSSPTVAKTTEMQLKSLQYCSRAKEQKLTSAVPLSFCYPLKLFLFWKPQAKFHHNNSSVYPDNGFWNAIIIRRTVTAEELYSIYCHGIHFLQSLVSDFNFCLPRSKKNAEIISSETTNGCRVAAEGVLKSQYRIGIGFYSVVVTFLD